MMTEVDNDDSRSTPIRRYGHRHDSSVSLGKMLSSKKTLSLEEALRYEVLESIDAQFIVLDSELTIIYANRYWQAFVQNAGIGVETTVVETVGMNYFDLLHRTHQLYRAQIDEVIQSIYLVLDGESESFEANYHIHYNQLFDRLKLRAQRARYNGEYRLLVCHDVISNEYIADTEQLDASDLMIRGVSYTINDLLASIQVNCELLQREVRSNRQATNILQRVFNSVRSATDLTKHLLSENKGSNKPIQKVQLEEIVEDAVTSIRSTLPATIDINTNIGMRKQSVYGEPLQLSKLLKNLFENAIDAIGEKNGSISITLTDFAQSENRPTLGVENSGVENLSVKESAHASNAVSIDQQYGDQQYAHLRIEDDGHGMDEKTLHRCFEPFYTTKSFGSRPGLGLSAVRRIVMSAGGRVIVTSTPEQGTIFDIYLPTDTQSYAEIK